MMNESTKESLMIGDWVKIKTYGVSDKFERTEAHIYVKVAEIGSGLITVDYNNDTKEPYRICENTEIEPIPLTPEILLKNGYYLLIEEDKQYRLDIQEGVHIAVDFKNDDEPWAHVNNNCYYATPYCRYVHHLQHAMHLCGIYLDFKI